MFFYLFLSTSSVSSSEKRRARACEGGVGAGDGGQLGGTMKRKRFALKRKINK